MTSRSLWRLLRTGRLRMFLGAMRIAPPFYRLVWLAGALRHGVLARLRKQPVPLERLVAEIAPGEGGADALEAWLRVGERLGELGSGPDGWRLRGFLARQLADPENDDFAAMLEETATLHHALLLDTPERLRRGELWSLSDQDGTVIARSSRVVELAVFDAIDALFPSSGPVRLLEIGCGSGTYMRHAAERNPDLSALGLELQPAVAEAATANLRAWGLEARTQVEKADVRERVPERVFDIVTLHNNIYYFPVEERVTLIRHLRHFLRPGGRLVLTTGCRGGSPTMHLLDLWSASTRGCGRLPEPAELEGQLREAGLSSVLSRRLTPGESYFAFAGDEPA